MGSLSIPPLLKCIGRVGLKPLYTLSKALTEEGVVTGLVNLLDKGLEDGILLFSGIGREHLAS